MILSNASLYFLTFLGSFVLSLILTPAARSAAVLLNVFDHPYTQVKTHKEPVPYLGGIAIFLSFSFSLLFVRALTSFPSGTLSALRGILIGGVFVCVLGLVDDIKHHGLHYRTKFLFQITAAFLITLFDVRIKFIQPTWLGILVTIVWVVGVTNAFNLIDIMDGLASSVAMISAMAFLFISLPTEEIYVNFAAAALAGATLGFLPYNMSKNWRIFMGDSGSLFLGFVASALSMGTTYSGQTELAVIAPIFVLAVPLYDTFLVFYLRVRRGMSPFLGSKDHFALRLELLGWSRKSIVVFTAGLTLALSIGAFAVTQTNMLFSILIYLLIVIFMIFFSAYVLKAKVQ